MKTANSNKKYTILKESKILSNKKTLPNRDATSMSINKKKGISLCSKDLSSNIKSQIKSTSVDPNKTNSVYNTSLYPLQTE